ncbi:MAG: M20/M25/M40 family metallo-hydrolase [Luminiphilus sp.]|jgi:acetylornithine deacetylase|nr:M20/M25/M40 family metallo-hydrolase [Luminiphilus sp.]|tara:strand:+ start:8885 stop:10120 length:1236 start_codon:yes stop_codon:yes gene_type:complete
MRSVSEILSLINEQECIDFLAKMVQHKSYTETAGERKLAEFMCEQMQELGIEAELQTVIGERRNAIGRYVGTESGTSLLFNGHLDTNPVTEGWTEDPWGGTIKNDCIYGIGVSNMKAGDAAFFSAVKTMIDAGVRPKGDVILTFVVGELQGGIGTVRAIEQGVKADYFINCEPTDLTALSLHAGAFNFIIELEGETRHISKREQAVDAVAISAVLIPRLNAMTFSGAKGDDHLSINRANVGTVRGALSREFHDWRPPQISDFVRLTGTARYAPSQSKKTVLNDIRAVLSELENEHPGLKANVCYEHEGTDMPSMGPFEVAKNSRIVKSLNTAYKNLRGEDQPTGPIRPQAFYGTDAAHFYNRCQMEGIVCGPGGKFNTMPDERVELVDYLDAVRLYLAVILDICGYEGEAP